MGACPLENLVFLAFQVDQTWGQGHTSSAPAQSDFGRQRVLAALPTLCAAVLAPPSPPIERTRTATAHLSANKASVRLVIAESRLTRFVRGDYALSSRIFKDKV